MTDPVHPTDHAHPGLSRLGWDSSFEAAFTAGYGAGDLVGRVLRCDLRSCLVALEGGEAHLPVRQGLLGLGEGVPTTGDWVVVRDEQVAAVLERRTAVVRAAADPGRAHQVLAANVDFVLVTEPLGERFRPRRIERLLVLAWQSGALPIVVLTKADRCEDLESALGATMALAPGVSVHAVSAPLQSGVDSLLGELAPGTTSVILGRSGAGKSTLANALSGGDAGLDTGPVRDDGKGRHTTVTRELVELSNGALLIDTPGLRSIGLVDATGAIGDAFSDVESLVSSCRFNDCAHDSEPGCAVKEAIATGDLEESRLDSYSRLVREQERLAAREDPKLRAERKAAQKKFFKQVRNNTTKG